MKMIMVKLSSAWPRARDMEFTHFCKSVMVAIAPVLPRRTPWHQTFSGENSKGLVVIINNDNMAKSKLSEKQECLMYGHKPLHNEGRSIRYGTNVNLEEIIGSIGWK